MTVGGTESNFWASGQPNYLNNNQACLALDSDNLNDVIDDTCWERRSYICEYEYDASQCATEPIEGKCLTIHNLQTGLSWFNAYQACMNSGGSLLKLDSAAMLEAVKLLPDIRDFPNLKWWLGARSKLWRWSDGDVMTFSQFQLGEPNSEEQACLALSRSPGFGQWDQPFHWEDTSCSQTYNFIGKFVASTTQITTTTSTTSTTSTTTSTTTTTTTRPPTTTTRPPITTTTSPPAATTTTTSAGTTTTTSAVTDPAAAAASSNNNNKNNDGDISTIGIVLLVLIIIIVLIIILVVIIFCLYRSKQKPMVRVGPSKYDARSVAPIPYTASIGEISNESLYTVSEVSSTAGLITNKKSRGARAPPIFVD